MAKNKDDYKNELIDVKIERVIESIGSLFFGLLLSIVVFYFRPRLASIFLVRNRAVMGLRPPGMLTTLVLSLFFSSSFWFYYANPDSWAFIFTFYLSGHSNDYSQLLDLENLLKTMSNVALLSLAFYSSARIISSVLAKVGNFSFQLRTLIFAVSIPYFAVPQSVIFVLDLYSDFLQSDIFLFIATLLILLATIVSTAIFISNSLQLSKIASSSRKFTSFGIAYFSFVTLAFLSIHLPHTIRVGGIANVKIEGPLNLSIISTEEGDCEIDFILTVKNHSQAPISMIEPEISSIKILPDPLHTNLYGYASDSGARVLETSSGTSKAIVLAPNEMGWIHFRLSIRGFTDEIAEQFLKDIELNDEGSSYKTPKIGIQFYLQSDGNMISDEVTAWVKKSAITSVKK